MVMMSERRRTFQIRRVVFLDASFRCRAKGRPRLEDVPEVVFCWRIIRMGLTIRFTHQVSLDGLEKRGHPALLGDDDPS